MAALVARTVTADTSGNVFIPDVPVGAMAGQQMYIVAAAAVILLGRASATDPGATVPGNVPIPLPGNQQIFLRAPAATVAVSYYYLSS